jgi:hypothetical protein
MKRRSIIFHLLFCFFGFFLASCGSSADFHDDVPTGSSPIVSRVDPTSGPVGTQVTIFGLGFSYVAPTNIIAMGTGAAVAQTYTILANPVDSEIETLTFTVPTGLAPGTYPVVVLVYDTPSNSDVTFTVTP